MSHTVAYAPISGEKIEKKSCCTCKKAAICISLTFAVLVVTVLLCIGIFGTCFYPLHASCDVDWTFSVPCDHVKMSLVSQIHTWESEDNCAQGGEKCLYALVNQTDSMLVATHETPKKRYIDNLTFTFTQDGQTCRVNGQSSSALWYAVLDMGTNYCNLHNLVTGAGLDKTHGYSESTANKRCTQYSSADCEVY